LALSQVLESKGDGLFASSCPFHWVLLKSTFYGDLNINGTTVRKAVGQWLIIEDINNKNSKLIVISYSVTIVKNNNIK
jgi:hypothetical protein